MGVMSMPQIWGTEVMVRELIQSRDVTVFHRNRNHDDVVVPVDVAAQTITSVAMDPINGVIYYATLDTFGIHRVNLTGENQTSILDEHPTAITSLEVDYATQNVYFVDSYENRLEVASTDGRRRRVLHDGLDTLLHQYWTMFYIDTGAIDREESPKIYSAAMDGSSPEAIVTGHPLNHPLYIAVDNGDGVDGLIYWTDVGTNMVYCASLLGEEPRAIAGNSGTSPPPPSSDPDSTRSGTGTEPGQGQGQSDGQGGQSDEQTGNQEEEGSLQDLGVGLGTVLVVAFVLFAVFVGNYDSRVGNAITASLHLHLPRSPSILTSPRSPSFHSSPSPPTHTKKSNPFHLPTKQCNFIRNNLSPVATPTSIPLKCVANRSSGVNEFVDEPEVYPISPKRVKKQTKDLHEKVALTKSGSQEVNRVDSKLRREKDSHDSNVSDGRGVEKPDCSSDSYSSSVTTVSATIEIEIEDLETMAAEEDKHVKKPSRSCLSSDSDSSQEKSRRRGLSVAWDVDGGAQPQPPPPPPPLPPRENNEETETPPPRPPKALLPCNESGHKERGGEGKGNGSSREDDGDSRQVLEQIAAKSGDHGNEEQVSPDVGEI
ncbi:Low-density lipoprotein receptor-related protein 4 [Geodia barretti]|uniref:Low-density lipoprotein receptor-related protein 4 n=1 Tax=Geodia barretti TaxID=519541 RepID=A0AA35RJC0_GEOBA|nr:Low-density lipoprotein receptor-related protein 4 [Geodia barretti]